jgi:hypothetical protein
MCAGCAASVNKPARDDGSHGIRLVALETCQIASHGLAWVLTSMISSVIFIVAACAVAVRCWPLVVVLFGTGTGTPHCAQSRHGAGMLALACRTTLDSTGLVFGASSRRHVHHHVSGYTLSTSRIGHVGSETDTMKKKHTKIAAIEPCSHLGRDLHCVEPANHTRALPTSSPQKCESLPAH